VLIASFNSQVVSGVVAEVVFSTLGQCRSSSGLAAALRSSKDCLDPKSRLFLRLAFDVSGKGGTAPALSSPSFTHASLCL
jgi:hypothetical protein